MSPFVTPKMVSRCIFLYALLVACNPSQPYRTHIWRFMPLPLPLPKPPPPLPKPRPSCLARLWAGEPETVAGEEGGRATPGRMAPPRRFMPANCLGLSLTIVVGSVDVRGTDRVGRCGGVVVEHRPHCKVTSLTDAFGLHVVR